MKIRFFRITLSVILVALMWWDVKWALYLLVTMQIIGGEVFAAVLRGYNEQVASIRKE